MYEDSHLEMQYEDRYWLADENFEPDFWETQQEHEGEFEEMEE